MPFGTLQRHTLSGTALLTLISVSCALVAIPEQRSIRTAIIGSNDAYDHSRLFLELSPLIQGPSWLPLHVKVVLEEATGHTIHRWDFVPLRATDSMTLQRLLTFQSVPATIRYQKVTSTKNKHDRSRVKAPLLTGFDIVLQEQNTRSSNIDSVAATTIQTKKENQREITELLLTNATKYCASYPAELHLLRNNCWTFAIKLYQYMQMLDNQKKLNVKNEQ